MSLKGFGARAAVLAAAIFLGLFCGACGDYFRPVANPLPPTTGGNPQRTAHAVVVSSNGSSPGAAVIIDVTGDTNVGTFTGDTFVGKSPVFAASNAGTDYVVNRDDDNVTTFTVPVPSSPLNLNKITLDAGAKPVFVAVAQGKVFVAESGLGTVIDLGTNQRIQVGSNPVALVVPPAPNDTQLYALNQADNTVSVIFPATDQVVGLPVNVGTSPLWGAASADGSTVFVLNQGSNTTPGTVSIINTTSDTVVNTFGVGIGSKYIFYEATSNRAYVASPGANSPCGGAMSPCLYVFENNTGMVTPVSMSGPPCNALHPIAVTALADGSRAYVADDMTNSVCVLTTTNNAFTTSIPVGTAPVFIASDPDSNRVLTANSGSFDVSLIQTISDTTVKQSDGVTPLTICAGPTVPGSPCASGFIPTFIAITP